MLIPDGESTLRLHLEGSFGLNGIAPHIFVEFDDRARMTAFGERGTAVFTSPSAIEKGMFDKYDMSTIDRSRI